MTLQRIKKGDEVVVLAGRDKGKQGKVLRIVSRERVLVDNVNLVKKHTKPNPNAGETGGIIEKESPIHVSNLALYNADGGKGERIGCKKLADGKKVRYFKSNGEVLDLTS